jgi:hypothetical protein
MIDLSACEIPCAPSADARAALARIGRTEDVKFSPDHGRLAIAGFHARRILVLGLRLDPTQRGPLLELDDPLEITSPALALPHGLCWADDRTLVVADRVGGVQVLRLPAGPTRDREVDLAPLRILDGSGFELLESPGSLALLPVGSDLLEVLVCNNLSHRVSQHLFDRANGFGLLASSLLLGHGLDVPDGIACSADGCWIAVSSHRNHCVLVYPRCAALELDARPAATLRGVRFPHGLAFDGDGRLLFAASAGEPVVQVFCRDGASWQGELVPVRTLRVMDDAVFERGHLLEDEGGPKGIDIDPGRALLVCTCKAQPLRFFSVGDLIDAMCAGLRGCAPARHPESGDDELEAVMRRHLRGQERTRALLAGHYAAPLHALRASRSWRVTAPLRWGRRQLRRLLS